MKCPNRLCSGVCTVATLRNAQGWDGACPSRGETSALRARGFSIFVVWGACAAGGRWGPVRGCAPPRPPLHSPRTTPLGFPSSVTVRGLRVFCCGSFLASLGDLPSRRAMPSAAFVLHEKFSAVWTSQTEGLHLLLYPGLQSDVKRGTGLTPLLFPGQGANCCRGRRHKEPKPTRRRGSYAAAPGKPYLSVRVEQGVLRGGCKGGREGGEAP